MELKTKRPPVAATTEGQPNAVRASGNASFAHCSAAGKQDAIAIPRIALERLVQSAIDLLDSADGDADYEPDDFDAEHDGREPEDGI